VIKVAIAALIPALIPSTFTINKKNSSIEDGVVNSFREIFSGFANWYNRWNFYNYKQKS